MSSLIGRNGIFWILFAVLGILLLIGISPQLIVGVMIISLGIYKLDFDIQQKKRKEERESLQVTLGELKEWMQKEYEYIRAVEAKYDQRFFHSGTEKAKTGKRMEKEYRELVRKLLQLENKMNDISRILIETRKRQ